MATYLAKGTFVEFESKKIQANDKHNPTFATTAVYRLAKRIQAQKNRNRKKFWRIIKNNVCCMTCKSNISINDFMGYCDQMDETTAESLQ